jgi:N,N'-diacetyllegionaminate synthase
MVHLIAEFCQNHNGDYALLEDMVGQAREAGATHGKIQTIFADMVSNRPQFEDGLIVDGVVKVAKRPYREEYDRLKKLELSFEQHVRFIEMCRRVGLEPMTTCFTRDSVDFVAAAGFREVKVASYDCASVPLLEALASRFERLVVSTGATRDEEVRAAAQCLQGKCEFTFLHCVTMYPTPVDEMHLLRMQWLKQFTSATGLSDHSLVARDGIRAALAAIYLGAQAIERHFTILPADQSKDGAVSILPSHLRQLSGFARLSPMDQLAELTRVDPSWSRMLGRADRELSEAELVNRAYFRGRFCSYSADGATPIYNWEGEKVVSQRSYRS